MAPGGPWWRAVGDDAGVVVDATVALGLADDGDDAIGFHDSVVDELRELGRVGNAVDRRRVLHDDRLGAGGSVFLGVVSQRCIGGLSEQREGVGDVRPFL